MVSSDKLRKLVVRGKCIVCEPLSWNVHPKRDSGSWKSHNQYLESRTRKIDVLIARRRIKTALLCCSTFCLQMINLREDFGVSLTAHNRMLGGCAKKTYMIIGVSGDNCWSLGPSISSANTSQISSLGLRKRKANTVSGCMATTIDDNTFPADGSPRFSYTHVRTRKRIPTMSKRAKREFDRSWPPMRMQRSRPFQPYPVWKQTQTWSRLNYAQG